eukprot:6207110-Pleurochrysis_carterae.AAC.1
MSPAHYHTTTPLRTLSYLATIASTSCVDAAASARALMHKLYMLLLAGFITRSHLALIRPIETHASAVTLASAITLSFALVGSTEAVFGSVSLPLQAALDLA